MRLSNKSRQGSSVGEVVNYMANDAQVVTASHHQWPPPVATSCTAAPTPLTPPQTRPEIRRRSEDMSVASLFQRFCEFLPMLNDMALCPPFLAVSLTLVPLPAPPTHPPTHPPNQPTNQPTNQHMTMAASRYGRSTRCSVTPRLRAWRCSLWGCS